MSEQAIFGWLITVDRTDGAAPAVYNVAIREERLAIEAVRRLLPDPKSATVKIKSKLTLPLFESLKMKPGDVMLGSRKKRPRDANQLAKSIVENATGEAEGRAPTPQDQGKDPKPALALAGAAA